MKPKFAVSVGRTLAPCRVAFVQTLRRAESRNPLIMLDEVDKLGRDFRGGTRPSALLELLDPEQNAEFRDTYLDVPLRPERSVSSSRRLTSLDTIPGARCWTVWRSSNSVAYTEQEKLAIGHAVSGAAPNARKWSCGPMRSIFSDDALLTVHPRPLRARLASRNLEREIGRVARKVVTKIAEGKEDEIVIDGDQIKELLGKPRFGYRTELEDRDRFAGCCYWPRLDTCRRRCPCSSKRHPWPR